MVPVSQAVDEDDGKGTGYKGQAVIVIERYE
jgi:hypothetical protein